MKTLRTPQHTALIRELKRLRIDAGLTQATLAMKLGVAQSYVAKVEGGERRLDVVEFIRWMDAADAFDTAGPILAYIRSAPEANS